MTGLEEEVQEKIDELTEKNDIVGYINDVLDDLSVEGIEISHENPKERWEALDRYEKWFNSAYPLIDEYLPDRKEEFEERYEEVRKILELDIGYLNKKGINKRNVMHSLVLSGINFQYSLVSSIPSRVETEQLRARRSVSSNIVTNEIQKAKELFDDGNIRASGVIAGVALERHLLTLCESSEKELDFGYMDGITSLAQELSNANEISDDDERNLEYLAGIRNKCSHATDEEPEEREVERLLNQSDEFIRS
jgi:hypothetical protein